MASTSSTVPVVHQLSSDSESAGQDSPPRRSKRTRKATKRYMPTDDEDEDSDAPIIKKKAKKTNKRKKKQNKKKDAQLQPAQALQIRADSPTLNRSGSDVCSVCLDKPVHPVELECRHIFCYLCAKGLVQGGTGQCSLCRATISNGYLEQSKLISRTRSDLESATEGVRGWQWFYEGRGGGWWKFEVRLNQEIEEAFSAQEAKLETLICGNLYVVDFQEMTQYRKDIPMRKRKIKRDVVFAQCKGVAGLVPQND